MNETQGIIMNKLPTSENNLIPWNDRIPMYCKYWRLDHVHGNVNSWSARSWLFNWGRGTPESDSLIWYKCSSKMDPACNWTVIGCHDCMNLGWPLHAGMQLMSWVKHQSSTSSPVGQARLSSEHWINNHQTWSTKNVAQSVYKVVLMLWSHDAKWPDLGGDDGMMYFRIASQICAESCVVCCFLNAIVGRTRSL